jgi:hypothetical protein
VPRCRIPAAAYRVRGTRRVPSPRGETNESQIHARRHTVDDGGKSITFHIDTSTFPNWNGTTQKPALKVSRDTLTYTVTTPSAGGAPNDVVWKRSK